MWIVLNVTVNKAGGISKALIFQPQSRATVNSKSPKFKKATENILLNKIKHLSGHQKSETR